MNHPNAMVALSPGADELRSVGAVMVEYNSNGVTAGAAAWAADLGLAVAVADNSGTYQGVGLVTRMDGNVGFGAACNAAVSTLPPEVDTLVLWNPDARIDRFGLLRLVGAVREAGWTAMAPSVGTGNVRTFGFAYPSLLRETWVTAREVWRDRTGSRRVAPTNPPERLDEGAQSIARNRRFGTAAMLVVDRAAFEEVGGFDERYFLYVEDLDLWDRLLSAGGRCGFAPSVRASHASAQGSDASAARRTVLRWAGVESFIASRHPHRWRIYRMAHRVGLRLLSNTDDEIVEVVGAGFAAGRNPVGVQDDIRSVALGARGAVRSRRATRLGWARTRADLAVSDLVLDVGSGAFPNPRADVLCERSPVRHHRTAVVDRPFVVADAQALPFRSGAFDFVIASHLAEHVADPALFCAELDRVAGSGYVETPSPLFEKIFPESNHLWTVRAVGRGQLRFEANTSRQGTRSRLNRIAYGLYYAGQAKEVSTLQAWSLAGRVAARLAFVVRGTLNRMGITVTRCRFGGTDRLSAEVRD